MPCSASFRRLICSGVMPRKLRMKMWPMASWLRSMAARPASVRFTSVTRASWSAVRVSTRPSAFMR